MPGTRVAAEGSVVHETFPEFLSAYSLDCTVLGLYSNSVQGLLDALSICSSCSSIHAQSRCYCIRQVFQLHSLEQVPKTYLLEPQPLAPLSGVCHETTSPGRSRFQYSEVSRCTDEEVGTVDAQSVVRQTLVYRFNQVWNQNTSVVLRPTDLLLSFSRIREFITTDTAGRQERAFSQTPPFQLLFMIPCDCHVHYFEILCDFRPIISIFSIEP